MNDLIIKFFKYLGWILYLGLFITAILFTREAIEKFFSGDTGITQHFEKKIDLRYPTITMCPKLNVYDGEFYKYGMDFNITYAIVAEDYLTYMDNLTLNIGENFLKISNTKVYLQEIYTHFDGVCYRIDAIRDSDQKYTRLEIWNINNKTLASFSFYLTSKENSYGRTWGSFKDGNAAMFDLANKKWKYFELIMEKYVSLKCSQQSFYQQVGSRIMESDFSNCSTTCMPATFPNVEYPMCPYERFKEWYNWNCTECLCNSNIIKNIIKNIEQNNDRLPFCERNQYKIIYHKDRDRVANINLLYRFATLKTEVHKEYLIYDVIGMVGLVGGTLGLFIGFSFSNVLTFLIEYLQMISLKICSRKCKNEIDDEKLEKDIPWEQKFVKMDKKNSDWLRR